MADITKAALRNRVLEQLSVIAAGETPASADQTLVEEAIDAAHATLRRPGLVPFATSAIPEWAQQPLRDWVDASIGNSYGKGRSVMEIEAIQKKAERELARAVAGFVSSAPVRSEYF